MEKFDMIRGWSMVHKLVVKDISWIWRDSWLKIRILVYHLRVVTADLHGTAILCDHRVAWKVAYKLCFSHNPFMYYYENIENESTSFFN